MPRQRRYSDAMATSTRSVRTDATTTVRQPAWLLCRLLSLGFAVATWLRFTRGQAPPGYLCLLQLPAENATRNTPADPPADPAAAGARSP
jgi:hypothetical protein